MMLFSVKRAVIALAALGMLAACGDEPPTLDREAMQIKSGREAKGPARVGKAPGEQGSSILEIFKNKDASVKVNRFLWTASLQVLDFLPVQSADPFTGVISTGYGVPPGGGRAYRATILISDPALDARSLNLSLSTQSGPVDAGTRRAVEDAILSRARQLRIQAGNF
ncbi:DUF3576 domain-containing protein [Roseovarius dicentrarchi]|uniref:DUF3576 domain-containing protein n=1 Tax=Roseovarius dicentrarchi TaxID=2250573 RepID=UPI000DE98F28|nr:DUF3576 domain-containing protein [Roseovarius dicentrarchi]